MTKAERVDRIRNSLYSEDELLRRLPEITLIDDDELREGVIRVFMNGCPDYFWERPSSSTGKYHSPDEIEEYGNWMHTKRVFYSFCRACRSRVEAGQITEYEFDEGKVAALIHDMMKYGWPGDQNDHTVDDHDMIAADVARNIGFINEPVCSVIEQHMGPWGEGPQPDTVVADTLHTVDMIASDRYNDMGMFEPAKELLERWPDINAAPLPEEDNV